MVTFYQVPEGQDIRVLWKWSRFEHVGTDQVEDSLQVNMFIYAIDQR